MVPTPDTGNYFSFKQMNTTHQASIAHFQLRNLMATTSRNDVFYAKNNVVLRTDAAGAPAKTAMNLTKALTEMGGFQITTLAASDDILIAGGFEGEYAFQNMSDDPNTATTVGRTKDRSRDSRSWITNHIHLFGSRNNYTPQAVLCSNDSRLRILDCTTNTFTHSFDFPLAVNCAATSPDGRMRVVVGDFRETLITNAETGQSFETLNSHTDDVFACDWADDGIHVATAAQDSTIVIWDARYWGQPLKVMHSELSIPRILRFSPVGSGPRVLVSAEADDYVNIYDAQTYESRQLLDFFGSTAGISMTADGSSLFVANSDVDFGGIMEFERCEWGNKRRDDAWEGHWGYMNAAVKNDWGYEKDMDQDRRVVCGWHARERRGLDLGELVV
jgi:WD40 repeat protein